MYLLNLGYNWKVASEVERLHGVVLLPAFNSAARSLRQRPARDLRVALLDPQLYLAGISVDGRAKACGRLASYPWFDVPGVEDFDSSAMGQQAYDKQVREAAASNWTAKVPGDIEQTCRRAIECQEEFGCTSIILPTPLISAREDEGGTTGDWIDVALEAARDLDIALPLLATIALDEAALNDSAFEQGGLIEAIIDQVSARGEDLDGVYLVVGQRGRSTLHPTQASNVVARAYLTLAHGLSQAGFGDVLTNFADFLGLAAFAVGATRFASGPSSSLRALNLDGLLDEGGGRALPWFYSHRTVGEYLSETDLDAVKSARLLRRVHDSTRFSAPLLARLRAGGSAAELLAWAESQNNYRVAHKHLAQRQSEEGHRISRIASPEQRVDHIIDWLETAEANALFMERRLKVRLGRRPKVDEWLSILAELLESE